MSRGRKPPNWRHSRSDFERWLRGKGAEPLGAKQHEFMRFQAHGILCIVYERNRKGDQSFVPELARQAHDAWLSRAALDLTNEPPDPPVEDWHATGIALVALGERAKAGAALDIPTEAAALGIDPARIVRSLRAQSAPVPESAAS